MVGGVTVNNGGTLLLDNTTTNNNTRLASTIPLALNGGAFTVLGANVGAISTSQSVAAITLGNGVAGGASAINLVKGTGGALTLTSGGLIRAAGSGATVNINDAANGANLGGAVKFLLANSVAVAGVTNTAYPVITTSAPHNLTVGQAVTIANVVGAGGVNGTFTVASVLSATTFTINLAVAPGGYTSGGTIAPALTGTAQTGGGGGTGIIPYATVATATGPDLVTYDSVGGTGVRTFTGFGLAYKTTVATAGAADNLNLLVSDAVASATAQVINALKITGAVTLNIPAGSSLTITSGLILVASGSLNVTGGGTLNLGSEGIVNTAPGTTATFGAALNLSGANNITYSNSASAAAVGTISDGSVSGILLIDGGAGYTSAPTATFVGGGGAGATGTATVDGGVVTGVTINLPGSGYTSAPTVVFSAPTASTITLNAANTLGTGATALNGGTLVLGNNAALSAGLLQLTSGTLQTSLTSGFLFPNAVFNNAAITLAGANPLLFGGTVLMNGTNNTLMVTDSAITAIDGNITPARRRPRGGQPGVEPDQGRSRHARPGGERQRLHRLDLHHRRHHPGARVQQRDGDRQGLCVGRRGGAAHRLRPQRHHAARSQRRRSHRRRRPGKLARRQQHL